MKKIKVKILGHPLDDTFGYSYFILTILKKYYEVEISENPDYLFYHDSTYEHAYYDCIKIFYTGENISPNFNQCDYAISYDYISFEDRHYRMPMYLVRTFYNRDELKIAGENYLYKQKLFTKEDLLSKTEFCSFVYSNYRGEKERSEMFFALNSYKKVNAGGAYLNNLQNSKKVANKLEFEMKHKFSIAFENSSRSGYTTEKLMSSIAANTIPIYWGNPTIGKEFNTMRFINCHDYKSFDEVVEKIKEIDSNDEMYLRIINEPFSVPGYDFKLVQDGLEHYLKQIIDQPLEKAKRRTVNPVKQIEIKKNNLLILRATRLRSLFIKILATTYQPFKKINFFERLKYNYFRNKQA